MDVDDTGLMAQLRGLCTNDRESMIREFIQVIGDEKVNPEEAKFYLEMNAWTLSDAIGAYYDNGQQNQAFADICNMQQRTLGMTLIQEANPEEVVPANFYFKKTFVIRNTGLLDWPPGCEIRVVDGAHMQQMDLIKIPQLEVGGQCEIAIPMISPLDSGSYQSQWRLYTNSDWSFGDSIFCIVNVDESLPGGGTGIEDWYIDRMEEHRQSRRSVEDPSSLSTSLSNCYSGTSGRPTTPIEDPEDEMME